MENREPNWRTDLNGAMQFAREILHGPIYTVALRFEWNDTPHWTTITVSDIRAHTRQAAVARAILTGQRQVHVGWDRIVIESATLDV